MLQYIRGSHKKQRMSVGVRPCNSQLKCFPLKHIHLSLEEKTAVETHESIKSSIRSSMSDASKARLAALSSLLDELIVRKVLPLRSALTFPSMSIWQKFLWWPTPTIKRATKFNFHISYFLQMNSCNHFAKQGKEVRTFYKARVTYCIFWSAVLKSRDTPQLEQCIMTTLNYILVNIPDLLWFKTIHP